MIIPRTALGGARKSRPPPADFPSPSLSTTLPAHRVRTGVINPVGEGGSENETPRFSCRDRCRRCRGAAGGTGNSGRASVLGAFTGNPSGAQKTQRRAFSDGLIELGLVPGNTFEINNWGLFGEFDRAAEMVQRLAWQGLICTVGQAATIAAVDEAGVYPFKIRPSQTKSAGQCHVHPNPIPMTIV